MDNFQFPKEIKNQKRTRKPLFVIATLVVVLVALIIYQNLQKFKQEPQQTPKYIPTEEQIKQAILDRAELSFPKINSSQISPAEELPSELELIIPEGAREIKYEKIVYENNKSGYSGSFIVPRSFLEVKREYNRIAVPDLIQLRWTEKFGIAEFKKGSFQIRVTPTYLEPNLTSVSFEALSLK